MMWLKWREGDYPNGGILADDMGLGKTLTILAYLKLVKDGEENDEDIKPKESSSLQTLVILPASLLHQWKDE